MDKKSTAISPLKNGLFVRRFLPNLWLRFLNHLYFFRKRSNPIPKIPKRILLCNIANFGDVVISTTVLPVIKKNFPDCEIGFLASSRVGASVLGLHPFVSRVHQIDHWAFQPQNRWKAFFRYRLDACRLCKEIKACHYDIAIDLYSFFPNAIPLLAKSQIPVRIGYSTGGFSNLLTHSMKWDFSDLYVGYAHLHLLKPLGIDTEHACPLPCYNYRKDKTDDVIVHMGCSHVLKEWKTDRWVELIQRLESLGWRIYLTGQGEIEKKRCDFVSEHTSAVNLCDQLDWPEFVSRVQSSRLVITVDSVASHVAAAAETPSVIIFSGINSSKMWGPPYSQCKIVANRTRCSPCFNKSGCSSMSCIEGICVDAVHKQAVCLLDQKTSKY